MGVLNVWDGTDWRKVGCGGAGVLFSDDFNRADGPLGNGWTENTAAVVDTGRAGGDFSRELSTDDFDITFTIPTPGLSGTQRIALIFGRSAVSGLVAPFTWLDLGPTSAAFRHRYTTGGVDSTLLSGGYAGGNPRTGITWAVGDVLRAVKTADTLEFWRNGVRLIEVSHTTTSGAIVYTGRWINFRLSQYIDDFIYSEGEVAPPGRLKLWDGTQWWVERCGEAYADAVLADSPAGYWRLGEPMSTSFANDSSGNSGPRNGTYEGGVIYGVTGLLTGDTDTAAYFDRFTGRRVAIGYGTWMDTTSALTIEALMKTNTTSGAYSMSVFDRDDGGIRRAFQFRVQGNVMQFILINGATVVFATGTIPVNDTLVHHVAATYDGSNIRVYVDGTLDVTVPTTAGLPTVTAGILLGTNQSAGYAQPFDGTIDEAAYYTTVLSADRVAAHAAAVSAAAAAPGVSLKVYDGTDWITVACMVPVGVGFGSQKFGTSPFGGTA